MTAATMVTYDLGCPSAFAAPSALQQAVLTFQRAGVTHVTEGDAIGDWPTFTKIAQQQGFKPKYGLPDEALISIAYGNQPPDADNMADAITVTQSRNGEEKTPGMTKTAGTLRCEAIFKSHGQPGVYEQPAGAGNACDQSWMFQEAVNHAPNVAPEAIVNGLRTTGRIRKGRTTSQETG